MSAYLVSFFAVCIGLIGILCLYGIQTPDKFASHPLLIGKES